MAALTAAFATPPAGKPGDTAIARCDDCQPELPPTVSALTPATPQTKHLVPASLKDEACAVAEKPCAEHGETLLPELRPDSAGPS